MDSKDIESALSVLELEVSDLSETADLWPEQPDDWRLGFMIEWDVRMSEFKALHDSYESAQLSPENIQRYRQLARQLRNQLPTVKQLGLTMPSVSLDEDAAA